MKKFLLSMMAVALVSSVNAQVYQADDDVEFGAWTPYDVDGDTYNWGATDLTGSGTPLEPQAGCLISNSWVTAGPLTPDNLTVSPVINLTGSIGATLTWGAGSVETTASAWYEEHYAVYVVTNPAAIIAGTYPTPVFEGTLTAGEVMQTQTIDITTIAAGQATVYLVFRHFNCTDENFIVVDDLKLFGDYASVEENQLQVSVYPNPAVEVLNISMNTPATSISIYSLDGQLVTNELINATTASINVSALTPGVYLYEVTTQDGLKSRNTFVKN